MEEKTFFQKIIEVQGKLKAPKGQTAKGERFAYKYRSCEDILEAVKPLLVEQGLLCYISDKINPINNKLFIEATATITDGDKSISVVASAEIDERKPMDASQKTGATSSYARKYALGGLFLIDDTKDVDTSEHKAEVEEAKKKEKEEQQKLEADFLIFAKEIQKAGSTEVVKQIGDKWFKTEKPAAWKKLANDKFKILKEIENNEKIEMDK